jgi:hypothetical protein
MLGGAMSFVDKFWFPVTPPERLAMLRILVGGYALVYLALRFLHLTSYATHDPALFQPVGVVTILPRPFLPIVTYALVSATALLSIAFAFGVRYRYTAPLFAAVLLWVLTYANSWGKILHTDNVLVLHVIVLSVAPAADALSIDARKRAKRDPHGRYGWAIQLMCAVGLLIYFLAGVAKLKNSGFEFVVSDTLRNYIAFDNARKIELGSVHSPFGAMLLPYEGLFTGLAAFSMVLELTAPLALLHRRAGVAWAILVWGFHLGVLALMAIAFMYQVSGVAFACFFRVERILELRVVKRLTKRFAPAASS